MGIEAYTAYEKASEKAVDNYATNRQIALMAAASMSRENLSSYDWSTRVLSIAHDFLKFLEDENE